MRPDLGGDPRPRIGDVHENALAVAPCAQGDRPGGADGVDCVREEVGPDLVELRTVDRDRRQRAVVFAADLDLRVLEPVLQDRQRRLEPFVHIRPHDAAPVHVCVRLDRADQRAHALG